METLGVILTVIHSALVTATVLIIGSIIVENNEDHFQTLRLCLCILALALPTAIFLLHTV